MEKVMMLIELGLNFAEILDHVCAMNNITVEDLPYINIAERNLIDAQFIAIVANNAAYFARCARRPKTDDWYNKKIGQAKLYFKNRCKKHYNTQLWLCDDEKRKRGWL